MSKLNVVPLALRTQMMDQRMRMNFAVYVKVLTEPMNSHSVSPSKEMGDCARQRKKSPSSAGIELTELSL